MTFPRIVCTLGTTTDDPAVLAAMHAAGMGLARVNTAYASGEELTRRLDGLRAAAPGVPALFDLKGPQLRVSCTTEKTDPATGATVTVPCRYPIARGDLIFIGFDETSPVRFNHDVEADLEPGDRMLFANGTITARVEDAASRGLEPRARAVLLEVEDAGEGRLNPFTGASVPGKRLSAPALGPRDLAAIETGVAAKVEWWALSFTRDAADVRALDAALREAGDTTGGICPKLEEPSGVARLEEIVAAVRAAGRPVAVMIGRGDLFLEFPHAQLARVQSDLVRRCRALDAPSIVATGLLLSLQTGRTPARSEVCDVAAAVREGATSLLLSDETSNGKDPAHAVRVLADLVHTYGGA